MHLSLEKGCDGKGWRSCPGDLQNALLNPTVSKHESDLSGLPLTPYRQMLSFFYSHNHGDK